MRSISAQCDSSSAEQSGSYDPAFCSIHGNVPRRYYG
jgi:hypothetical protein